MDGEGLAFWIWFSVLVVASSMIAVGVVFQTITAHGGLAA